MSFDERTVSLLQALPGRVEELEFKLSLLEGQFEGENELMRRFLHQQTASVVKTETGKIIPLASDSNRNTLTEDIKLTEDNSVLQFINPNGGARTIRLPVPSRSDKWYIVTNTATP